MAAGGNGREGGSSAGISDRGGDGARSRGGHCWTIVINLTIFLPITDGAFVDTNDPFLTWYRQVRDCANGAHCGMSVFGNYETSLNDAGNGKSNGQQLA